MRIKEIELDNFKSFGKQTLVPLLDGFTTISGPNGSGKSNIIDSLLFALGLSSTRTMRAERLPDLLNNLSGRNEARVRVKFTNDEGDELEVTRRIKVKDNGYTSTYILNGKVSTLSEVHEELIKYNVSPTGYNVIMQGDVTGIVTMSATERRKIIDELAGVAEFDRRIDQAQNELTAVGEKIELQKIVLTEILARLEVLKTDRDQALKYLDLKTQKETVERDLVFVRAAELEEKAAAELKEIEKLNAKEESLNEKLDKTEVALVSLRAELGRIEQEIREKGGNEQLLIRQELENKRGELTREENKLSNLEGVIGEKTKQAKQIGSQIKTIDRHLSDLGKQKKQHTADQQAVREVLGEKQAALNAILAEIDGLRAEKDKSSDKIAGLHTDLQKLRDERHQFEVRKTALKTKRESLEGELENLRNRATEQIGRVSQVKGLLGKLESEYQDHRALVAGIERSIMQYEAELESTREEIETKRQAQDSVNRRLIELETTREVQGESGYGKAVEAVLAANIAGVHGTIGQLGRVDERFTTALETAIGPRLGHIVVDDDEIAKRCIEFLKANQAGRATFVPLNRIQTQPPGLLPNRPGVIDFAYNLIDFNPRFVKAFQYACGQTIVLDTMDNARKLINQARMVTLEGELFDKSGSISGGNDNKARMHFGSRGETDLSVLKQTAKSLAEQLRWLKDSIKELENSLAEERAKLNKAKENMAHKLAELEAKRKLVKDTEEEVEGIKPKLREKGDEIDALETESNALDASIKEITVKIESMEGSLESARDKGHKSKLDNLILQSEELRQTVNAVDAENKEIQRHLDRIETEERVEITNRENLTVQANDLGVELDDLEGQKPLFENNIATLRASIAEMEAKVSELSEELESMRQAKEDIHEKITQSEIERTKHDQELIRVKEQRNERKISHYDVEQQLVLVREEIERILAENPQYEKPNAGTVEQLKQQVERLERRMRALEPVNMKALEEYNQTAERQQELSDNLDTLADEKEEIIQRIDGYGQLKKETFLEAFNAINTNFQQIFAELSHGTGRLELEHPESPFEGGLVIRAQPRDKKMQRIEALSGGEKSLTALSFVFAFQRFAPAPFYAFDEVDMMLDGANAERLAQMVKRQSESAQFVVVSLRRPMIENADHAVGVSLRADGYSRTVGIKEVVIPDEEPLKALA
ncbi:MAG: chromosome segregation protein SMC [Candidatus Obscuribacter phosphatis]|uniref:Chromosome partition protein Smc n=1 Tax=Candidatus Obscuribacter phosphatis TaxID=1906157 RepID=A0A8J7PBL5_9BACT|nr:chromosome segregation protein SMC [Candidatus Obscuribacter phosphatis]